MRCFYCNRRIHGRKRKYCNSKCRIRYDKKDYLKKPFNSPSYRQYLAVGMVVSGMTLEGVGDYFSISRERVRQYYVKIMGESPADSYKYGHEKIISRMKLDVYENLLRSIIPILTKAMETSDSLAGRFGWTGFAMGAEHDFYGNKIDEIKAILKK